MNEQSAAKSPEIVSIEIDPVLDDPRWEKLALGEATREEIGDLLAWATRSKAAKAAWEAFRPATGEERERLTTDVLLSLDAPMLPAQRERLDRLFATHKSLPPPTLPAAIDVSDSSIRSAGQREHASRGGSRSVQAVPRTRQRMVGLDGPFRPPTSITTSGGVVFSQEPTEMTLIDEATSLIMGPPVEVDVAMPERRPRQTRRVALAFFGGFAAAIVGLFIAVSFHEKPMPEQDFAMRAEPVSSLSAEVLPIYSSVPAVVFGEPDIPFGNGLPREGVKAPLLNATKRIAKPTFAMPASAPPSSVAPQVLPSGNRVFKEKSLNAASAVPATRAFTRCTGSGIFKRCEEVRKKEAAWGID